MDQRILIIVAIGAALVLGYFLVMRVFFKQSKELDKQIDPSKMRKWKDDED
jgi:uncharacterized protein YneF (UPF0154 family)